MPEPFFFEALQFKVFFLFSENLFSVLFSSLFLFLFVIFYFCRFLLPFIRHLQVRDVFPFFLFLPHSQSLHFYSTMPRFRSSLSPKSLLLWKCHNKFVHPSYPFLSLSLSLSHSLFLSLSLFSSCLCLHSISSLLFRCKFSVILDLLFNGNLVVWNF